MTEPSKVLHIRNVGPEISENDLLQLVQRFGVVDKMVVLRAKNQSLVQMQDITAAISVVDFFSSEQQANIRGRNVYIQFSSHQELTTLDHPGGGLGRRATSDQDLQPNRILLVTIHNPIYPITVDVLHQVFSTHGFVEKIVTFQKSAGLQALLQYTSQQHAVTAKNLLQNRNIYDGCCTLDIQFSNLPELQVNFNNERTWDYTDSSLPSENPNRNSNHNNNNFMVPTGAHSNNAVMGSLPIGISGTNDRATLLVSNLDPERIDADKLFNLFSNYGNIIRIKLLHNKPDHALIQMGDGLQAEVAVMYLKGIILFGKRLEVNYSKHPQINPSLDTHDYSTSSLNRFNRNVAKNYKYCSSPTKMIHISSLPADITEDDITAHLAPHGNIMNIKVFDSNGKKQALALFESEEEATEAMACKHASLLNGSTIRLAFSKLSSI